MLTRALTLTLLLSTCTSTTSSESPRADLADPDPAPIVVVEDEPTPARATDADLPDCPDERATESLCTESGKLAGRIAPVDTVRLPTDAEVIYASPEHGTDQQSLTIALRGETLWIRAVDCGACRRVMGHGFEGQLDHLSAEQLAAVCERFGIAGSELSTAQAWRAYVTSDEGVAQLSARFVGVP